jgi:hypothetical protein
LVPPGCCLQEPCLLFVKLQVVGLRNIDPQRLLSTAVTTNRTVQVRSALLLV